MKRALESSNPFVRWLVLMTYRGSLGHPSRYPVGNLFAVKYSELKSVLT